MPQCDLQITEDLFLKSNNKYSTKALIIIPKTLLCDLYWDNESKYDCCRYYQSLFWTFMGSDEPLLNTMWDCYESHIPHEFDILENKLAVPSQNCMKFLFIPLQHSASVTHTTFSFFFPDKVKLSLNFTLKSNGHDVMVLGQNDLVCLLTEKAYSCMFGWERSI